jgi:hypothetical protein
VIAVNPTTRRFDRREEFDLAAAWQQYRKSVTTRRYAVECRAAATILPYLRRHFPDLTEKDDGTISIGFERLEDARAAVLSWGGDVEVLAPEALRRSVADFAGRAAALY